HTTARPALSGKSAGGRSLAEQVGGALPAPLTSRRPYVPWWTAMGRKRSPLPVFFDGEPAEGTLTAQERSNPSSHVQPIPFSASAACPKMIQNREAPNEVQLLVVDLRCRRASRWF